MGTVNDSEVVDCMHELTLLSSCGLFSRHEKAFVVRALVKIKLITLTLWSAGHVNGCTTKFS